MKSAPGGVAPAPPLMHGPIALTPAGFGCMESNLAVLAETRL